MTTSFDERRTVPCGRRAVERTISPIGSLSFQRHEDSCRRGNIVSNSVRRYQCVTYRPLARAVTPRAITSRSLDIRCHDPEERLHLLLNVQLLGRTRILVGVRAERHLSFMIRHRQMRHGSNSASQPLLLNHDKMHLKSELCPNASLGRREADARTTSSRHDGTRVMEFLHRTGRL